MVRIYTCICIAFSLLTLYHTSAFAQVTCGRHGYCGYTEKRYEGPSNRSQKEKRLRRDELGGPSRSRSDYVYGTRDRRYERDYGGPGRNYRRDRYYNRRNSGDY